MAVQDYALTNNITKKGKPVWLRKHLPTGSEYEKVKKLLLNKNLNTVCEKAKCPNMWECFSCKTATFMILGSQCTRNCRFCNITFNSMLPFPDPDEPLKVAKAAFELGLKYVVVTSVTRDDLKDGGAGHFAKTIFEIRKQMPEKTGIEVLIPDFKGHDTSLYKVIKAGPDVLNHNIETVPSLYKTVRPEADYKRSLRLFRQAYKKNKSIPLKSGIMLGLGEKIHELEQTMKDLLENNCTILTLGQYLQPTKKHLPIIKYYTPHEFIELKKTAHNLGFKKVASSPFVRSSYKAKELLCSNH